MGIQEKTDAPIGAVKKTAKPVIYSVLEKQSQ